MANESEASASGGGGSRHQLVVLTVSSGDNFPSSSSAAEAPSIVVRAELSGVILFTDPVVRRSTNPDLEEQQLGQLQSPNVY